MSPAKSACAKKLLLKPAAEIIRQGMKEALKGNTLPVSELWKGIDAR